LVLRLDAAGNYRRCILTLSPFMLVRLYHPKIPTFSDLHPISDSRLT
jgi:hypothetical protein